MRYCITCLYQITKTTEWTGKQWDVIRFFFWPFQQNMWNCISLAFNIRDEMISSWMNNSFNSPSTVEFRDLLKYLQASKKVLGSTVILTFLFFQSLSFLCERMEFTSTYIKYISSKWHIVTHVCRLILSKMNCSYIVGAYLQCIKFFESS